MSKRCPYCKSKKVGSFNDEVACCTECHRAFGKSRLIDNTLFYQITESPETLAEKFVEYTMDGTMFYSVLTKEDYCTKERAIAATVKKLKEVCDE